MEDEESGGFNSSDGGSGSWSPNPSQKTNQHAPSREGLHFLPLKSWSSGKALFYLCNCRSCVSTIKFTIVLRHFCDYSRFCSCPNFIIQESKEWKSISPCLVRKTARFLCTEKLIHLWQEAMVVEWSQNSF
jgi:hypothetical protein